jgi:hypothetical protein
VFTTLTLDEVSPCHLFPFLLFHPQLHTLQIRQATRPNKTLENYLGSDGPLLDTSFIDVTRFNKLVSLHLDSVDNPLLSWLAVPKNFPPLKQLIISNANGSSFTQIVKACCESILHLEVGFRATKNMSGEEPNVTCLPRLKHLRYQIAESRPMSDHILQFPIQFKTPNLQSYHESQSHFASPLHSDTDSVSELWIQSYTAETSNFYVTDIRRFPSVETIVTDIDTDSFKRLRRLLQFDKRSCPDLAICHYYSTLLESAWSEELDARGNRSMRPLILFHPDSLPRSHIKVSIIAIYVV